MSRAVSLVIAMTTLLLCSTAAAETLYVTDQLYLGLYASKEASGRPLSTVVSGTPLNVLERGARVAKVRTPDGSVGWVKTAYLVADKPARLIVSQLQAQTDTAKKQLAAARKRERAAEARATELQQKTATATRLTSRQSADLQQLREQNQDYRQQAAAYATSVSLPWYLLTSVLALAAGFAAALLWVDRRIRKRHGGFRIY